MPAASVIDDVTTVAYWRARAEQAEAQLVAAQARITELSEHIAVLNRLLFGRSSEKARPAAEQEQQAPDQDQEAEDQEAQDRDAEDEDQDQEAEAAEPDSPDVQDPQGNNKPKRKRGQQRGSKGHGRRDYTHLDTREEIHDVPADQRVCPTCGTEFELFDAETSEQLDWQVTITRILHRRLRYRRRCACSGARTVTAPVPPKPIPKGRFTAEFLARLLYEKYVLGRPLHRIARALAADGLDLAEGTLCGALQAVADLLAPVEQAIVAHGAQAVHTHADETSWRVYEQVDGKDSNRWWLWVFLTDDVVVFVMDPTRSTKVLEQYFGVDRAAGALPEGRLLLLSTDFYAAYQAMARLEGVDPLWCWAHMRRHFIRAGDAHVQLRPWRDQWVSRIADLYLAHRALAAAEPGSPAHAEAQRDFDAALAAIDDARQEEAAMPGLHQAARKVLATLDREWDGLVRHRDFPDIELDNNSAERALRTPVVGRKNYYGSQARWAADLAARVWTITGTAERNGREPLAYLTEYLEACATAGGKAPEGQALQRFLPWLPNPSDTAGSRVDNPGLDATGQHGPAP